MKKQVILALVLLTGIAANAQVQNMNFEHWTEDTGSNIYRPDNWVIGQGMGQFGIYRDSLPQNGDFAITLSRWYYYTFDDAVQTAATTLKPVELTGYYKYTDNIINEGGDDKQDTAHVYVYAKKWNANLQQNDTIGRGHLMFTGMDYWTEFSCPVYYTSNETPDSVTIRLTPTERYLGSAMGTCAINGNGYCSYFSVDNLKLTEIATGINEHKTPLFMLYPNPANDKFYIATASPNKAMHYTLVDATGRSIGGQTVYTTGDAIDISALKNGVYFLRVDIGGEISTQKIVKQ